MLRSVVAFVLGLGLLGPVRAQVLPPNEAGMSMGHVHLNVRDIAAHKRFWVEQIGATPVKLGPIEGVKLPGLIIFFRQQEPTGPVAGTVINHLGLKVRKLSDLIAKFEAAGSPVEKPRIGRENTPQTYVTGPDQFRMELVEDPKIPAPVVSHHLHYFLEDPAAVKAWYVKTLLAAPTMRGPYESGDVPGMNLTFAPNRSGPTVPTRGRVLDHIGFEVKNLEAFCKKLEAAGVKFDSPYRRRPDLGSGLSTAFFTDPWGVYIELTEGLNQL
jgi:catechol 2,3-dioxygenase-like lactoylglutathione lyase family enzyme